MKAQCEACKKAPKGETLWKVDGVYRCWACFIDYVCNGIVVVKGYRTVGEIIQETKGGV